MANMDEFWPMKMLLKDFAKCAMKCCNIVEFVSKLTRHGEKRRSTENINPS
jgi:hypothetical protein